MNDFTAKVRSMSLNEMWAASRRRTGCCHFCHAQLTAGEDHTICDKCWDQMVPEEREED